MGKSCWMAKLVITGRVGQVTLSLFRSSPFFARRVFLHKVEKIPSVQSFVATSNRPNICGAVMALGFILISL